MVNIEYAKQLVKRVLLSNVVSDGNIYLTPLLSGKHGIGKSMAIKEIADSIGGVAIIVDGSQLKEGEITGLPYQCQDEHGQIRFEFLPHYSVRAIQEQEKRLYVESHPEAASLSIHGLENPFRNEDLNPS